MQMAKKGKYGKQWAQMKASLKGGAEEEVAQEEVVEQPNGDESGELVVDENVGQGKDEEEIVEAEQVNESDEGLPDAGEAKMAGGKRHKSRKNNKRKGKKSRKQRRSRKH